MAGQQLRQIGTGKLFDDPTSLAYTSMTSSITSEREKPYVDNSGRAVTFLNYGISQRWMFELLQGRE